MAGTTAMGARTAATRTMAAVLAAGKRMGLAAARDDGDEGGDGITDDGRYDAGVLEQGGRGDLPCVSAQGGLPLVNSESSVGERVVRCGYGNVGVRGLVDDLDVEALRVVGEEERLDLMAVSEHWRGRSVRVRNALKVKESDEEAMRTREMLSEE